MYKESELLDEELLGEDEPVKSGLRARPADMPRLARWAAGLVEERKPGEMLEVSAFKPEEIASEKLVAITLRISAAYNVGYVRAIARHDPGLARFLADTVEIPLVRTVGRGKKGSKKVVEVVTVGEFLRRRSAEIGERAAELALGWLKESEPVRTSS